MHFYIPTIWQRQEIDQRGRTCLVKFEFKYIFRQHAFETVFCKMSILFRGHCVNFIVRDVAAILVEAIMVHLYQWLSCFDLSRSQHVTCQFYVKTTISHLNGPPEVNIPLIIPILFLFSIECNWTRSISWSISVQRARLRVGHRFVLCMALGCNIVENMLWKANKTLNLTIFCNIQSSH